MGDSAGDMKSGTDPENNILLISATDEKGLKTFSSVIFNILMQQFKTFSAQRGGNL